MNKSIKNTGLIALSVILLFMATVGYGIYSYQSNTQLETEKTQLSASLSSTTASLALALKEKTDLVNTLQAAANKNKDFADQLTQATETVDKLQWMNMLDPQLLQKYSKVYFLSENYVPRELSPIDSKYLYTPDRSLDIEDRVLPFLQKMFQAASDDNVAIKIDSAYRSFGTQATLKSNYIVKYGSGANSFSAEQGYSEHQLGTALDFTTPTIGGSLTGFEKTAAYAWLNDNAYKYGFILSYPPNNAYYIFEPWHWRFIGIELATKLHDENKHFYDLDQREISTYLGNMYETATSSVSQ